jgi:oxalate---CoA ligase
MHRDLPDALKAIEQFASAEPQVAALLGTDGSVLTHAELWRQTAAVASRLNACGIGPQETVAVLVPQGMLQTISVFGALSGYACAALQPRTVPDEVKTFLRRLSASVLIASPEFNAEAEAAFDAGLVVVTCCSSQPPEEWGVDQPVDRLRPAPAASDAVLFQMTSATTGVSRIVPTSVATFNSRVSPIFKALNLTAADRQLQMTSFCHAMAIFNTLAQLQAGGSVIITGGFDPALYQRWIEDLRPTWYACSPVVHKAALEQLKDAKPGFSSSLRFVLSTGAPLPQETKTALASILRVPVFNDYGSTEAGFIASEALKTCADIEGSAGRSYASEIRIMDSSGELLPAGEEGEIVIRGDAVFTGYLDNEPAGRAAFRNGWLRTGDAGRLDAEGNLFITGRLKEMINRGGEKISPPEVDAVIGSHPAVLEAAAFSVPHPTLGEDVACAVVLRGSAAPVGRGEIRRFAAERLARFKIPSRIYFVDEIPRGELNKPQRWLLTERFGGNQAAAPTPDEVSEHANDDIFPRLYEIWTRILNRDDLGFDEDFFTAGGDSLAAINMLAEVDHRLGSNTSTLAASFLDEPTLAHLAELVAGVDFPRPEGNDSNDLRIFPVRDEGCGQCLFCIPADGEEGLYFRRLATHLRGQMDLSIIRPSNAWHSQALYTLEQAGKTAASLIRRAQGQGPYFVAGFCYGGLVAVEAVRQLVSEGRNARLVLFDTYMPDFPSLVSGWNIWFENVRRQSRAPRPRASAKPRVEPRRMVRYTAWFALRPFRRQLRSVEHVAFVKWVLKKAQGAFFPLYETHPVDAPIIHFLSTDEPRVLARTSRSRWGEMTRQGFVERLLAFDHANIFHESNLTEIVNALLQWSNA